MRGLTTYGKLLLAATALLLCSSSVTLAANPPSAAEVKRIVEQHLRAKRDYAPGDLLSRGDVEPIFNDLLTRGLASADITEDFYDDFVPDASPLVRALRTEAGRKFMRQVGKW